MLCVGDIFAVELQATCDQQVVRLIAADHSSRRCRRHDELLEPPEPLAPTSAITSPRQTSKSIGASAHTEP